MAECAGLLNRCRVLILPGVRIPPSPLDSQTLVVSGLSITTFGERFALVSVAGTSTETIRSVWQRFILAVECSLISLTSTFVVRISSLLTETVIDAGFTIHCRPTIGLLQKPNLVHFTLGILAAQMPIMLNHLGIGMS